MDKNISDPRPAEKPEPAAAAPTPTPDGDLSTDDPRADVSSRKRMKVSTFVPS
jgi:hypothetical protein